MARIAVAATAPFGADVLRAARGAARGLGPAHAAGCAPGPRTPGRAAAREGRRGTLGVPVLQPERPEPGLDLGAPVVVVCAYGLLIPEELLVGEDVAQRPSFAPAALAGRSAGRARDPRR